jgi:hypothetical protein
MNIYGQVKSQNGRRASASSELTAQLAELCEQNELYEAHPAWVAYALTADPCHEAALLGTTEDDLAVAEIVASLALREPSIRKLAAEAAYEAAQQLQAQAADRPGSVHRTELLNKSLTCIMRAIEYDTQTRNRLFAAQTQLTLGRADAAFEQAYLALASEPTNPELLQLVGLCAVEAGEPDKGERYLLQAAQISPALGGVNEGLAAARRAKRIAREIDAEEALWPEPERVRERIRNAYAGDREAMAALARDYYNMNAEDDSHFVMAYLWYSILARYGDKPAKEKLRVDPALWSVNVDGQARVERWMRAHISP